MDHRLVYEFSRLGQTASSGFTSTNYALQWTGGTNNEGAPWAILDNFINEPDSLELNFGISTQPEDTYNDINSLGLVRDIGSQVNVFGEGYTYIRDWLIDHADAPVNSVLVRITDVACPKFLGYYQIEQEQIKWCDGGECQLNISLEEYTPKLNCLQNTFIYDNHQGWFPPEGIIALPLDPFMHPRYRYCDDIKPQLLQNFIFGIANGINIMIMTLIGAIIGAAQVVQSIINFVGGSGTADFADNLQSFVYDQIGDVYENLIGCGRKYPAPFVRTYFQNACDKCGITFSSNIFNGETINGKEFGRYYNTCYLFAPEDKGVREDDPYDWLNNNKPELTAPMLAAQLARLFNAKFGLEGDTFYFHSRDTFPAQILFDFTTEQDSGYILDYICYNNNTRDKRYAATSLEYALDAADLSGNDARHRYNGTKMWSADNIRFKGTNTIKIDNFSVARFTNDGIQKRKGFKDLNDSPFFQDSTLLVEKDAFTLPKLLIWDGVSEYSNAEVIKLDVLDLYFTSQWQNVDYAADELINLSTFDYFAYNYPLYFDPLNAEPGGGNPPILNIFSMHSVDNPTNSGLHNEFWTVKLEACCDVLNRLIDDSPDGVIAHIDYLVQLRTGVRGSIENVMVVYGDDELANYVELSGVVSYQQ